MARKILLADDSVTAQNMGRKILADAGYDVVTVNNGSAALKRINEVKPDLIVLDVYMPGYSGLEVCQRLKDTADTEHIPVLLTVGKLEPFKPEEARRVRADAHIIKPFEASELLTAITKLEDRMVPLQADGSRFSTSVSGVERFGGDREAKKSDGAGEADTGWKSRLRFPSKKKKEEAEPEPEEAEAASFREFRKGKGKSSAGAPFTVKAPPPPGQEPGLVPDIPRDITPEELDALSALAAKLDGPIPAAENVAPLADKMGPVASAAEVAAPKEQVAEAAVPVAVPEAAPAAAVAALPEFPVEAPVAAAESAAMVEPQVAHTEPTTHPVVEVKTAEVPVGNVVQDAGARQSIAVATVPVNAAQLAEAAAPVDRDDEPIFASAANAVAPAVEEKTPETKVEEKPVEAVAEKQASAVVTENLKSKPEAPSVEAEKFQDVEAQDVKAEEPKADEPSPTSVEPAVPVAASAAKDEERSPSDEELAEALRLLTPATTKAEVTKVPAEETPVAAVALAEEAARGASMGSRWVAQPVALSADEAALSLEAEMLHAFASMPGGQAASQGNAAGADGATGVSAITAAVENRLASTDWASGAKDLAEQGTGAAGASGADEHAVETSAANKATPFVVATAHGAGEPVVEVKAVEAVEARENGAEQKDVPAIVPEAEAAEEEAAPATFADAMGKNEIEETVAQHSSSANGTELPAANVVQGQDSSPEVGSEESMGKEVKGKKSNWHQIRTAPAGAAAGSDVVEAAKQEAEEAPKTMAAAAAAEGSSAPDASTIASIVDSVMADLRPKIVEEIAKKLAGK